MFKNLGKWVNLGLIMAIGAGLSAYSEAREKQRQEETIEDLKNRVALLEAQEES